MNRKMSLCLGVSRNYNANVSSEVNRIPEPTEVEEEVLSERFLSKIPTRTDAVGSLIGYYCREEVILLVGTRNRILAVVPRTWDSVSHYHGYGGRGSASEGRRVLEALRALPNPEEVRWIVSIRYEIDKDKTMYSTATIVEYSKGGFMEGVLATKVG